MENFKDYLKSDKDLNAEFENLDEAAWQNLSKSLSFYVSTLAIPFTPKHIEEVFGKTTVTTYHVTALNHIMGLNKTGKSKKSISTFTNMSPDSFDSAIRGIRTDGGFVAEVEGTLIFKSPEDIMSIPDTSGRRWMGTLMQAVTGSGNKYLNKVGKTLQNDMRKGLIDILLGLNDEYATYLADDLAKIKGNQQTVNLIDNFFSDTELNSKERSKFYKSYIELGYSVLKKRKRSITKNLFELEMDTEYWNEVLVNKFHIKRVFASSDLNYDDYYLDVYDYDLNEMESLFAENGIELVIKTTDEIYNIIHKK